MNPINDIIRNALPEIYARLEQDRYRPFDALASACADDFPLIMANLDRLDLQQEPAESNPVRHDFLTWLAGWVSVKNALLNALPELYRALVEEPSHPLLALLAISGNCFLHIVFELDRIDTNFDPLSTSAEQDSNDRSFLDWLAGWVVLDIDLIGIEADATRLEAKKRFLIRQATYLYRIRGTTQGLKALIELLFDIEVEIREWQWPQGMVVGCRSTLNVDTRLMEETDRQCCFEVRWNPGTEHWDRLEQLTAMIRTVIDREKPAHTQCYFNVVRPEKPAKKLPNLVINVTSTVGAFVI
jgi:phage tail-like protein